MDTLDTVNNATAHDTVRKMPSTSGPQARLMAAAAHTPGGYGGVSQGVGQEFNQADKGSAMLKQAMANRKRGAAAHASPKQPMPMHSPGVPRR